MAYILRSLAVIGVIALNSPVHGSRPDTEGAVETVRAAAKIAGQVDARSAMNGVAAAREAAEILAGLDPDTRKRLLDMTLQATAARATRRLATPQPASAEEPAAAPRALDGGDGRAEEAGLAPLRRTLRANGPISEP